MGLPISELKVSKNYCVEGTAKGTTHFCILANEELKEGRTLIVLQMEKSLNVLIQKEPSTYVTQYVEVE